MSSFITSIKSGRTGAGGLEVEDRSPRRTGRHVGNVTKLFYSEN